MKNPQASRIVSRGGRISVERIGFERDLASDMFHILLRKNWPVLLLLVLIFVVSSNLIFAAIYYFSPAAIENAREGSFLDTFFFSVQTMATVGYGHMRPIGNWTNLLASVEAIYGLLVFAVVAGLIFAKFSKPTSKLIFSQVAVVAKRNGQPALMFRMVNERTNQILDGNLNVTLMLSETTLEGDTIRVFRDMNLYRNRTPIFALTFTAVHIIDEKSPLYGQTLEALKDQNIEVIITFSGVDETFSQTIYARHSYILDEIRWDHKFADIIGLMPDGRRSIDFRKFHDVTPIKA